MATQIMYPHPSGAGPMPREVEGDVIAVTTSVNEAIRIGEKFVTFKVDGKDVSFVAADISGIHER